MIKNERQHQITCTQAGRFRKALLELEAQPQQDLPAPNLAQVQRAAVRSQLADLDAEIQEYNTLKNGTFPLDSLKSAHELPNLLIKARISQGLTQGELAGRVGMKQQQIQRYEATDYVSAKFSKMQEIANALMASGNTG